MGVSVNLSFFSSGRGITFSDFAGIWADLPFFYVLKKGKCGTFCAQHYIFKGLDHGIILISHYGFLFVFCFDWYVERQVYVVPSAHSTMQQCAVVLNFLVILPCRWASTNFTWKDLPKYYTMSVRSRAATTPKAAASRPGATKSLDPNNPSDNAFLLVIDVVFGCDVLFCEKKTPFFPLFSLHRSFSCSPPHRSHILELPLGFW
jgi:hypothetical protein